MGHKLSKWLMGAAMFFALGVMGQQLFAQQASDYVVDQFEETIDTYGTSTQFKVASATSGSATINVTYALAGGAQPVEVNVNNGQFVTLVSFAATGGWSQWQNTSVTLQLAAGVTGAFNRLLDSAAPFKQRYGHLVPQAEAHWLKQLISITDCVAFYLEEQRHGGKASRTMNTARIHLERFRDFCQANGIEQIADINSGLLEAYQHYLTREKNVFTGKVISLTTQMERMDSVARMLSRLHYYGIMPEPLAFITPSGTVH